MIEFKKEEDNSPPIFDLMFDVVVSEQSGLAPFPQCLSAESKAILDSLENLKDHIVGALQELPLISHDVDISLGEITLCLTLTHLEETNSNHPPW